MDQFDAIHRTWRQAQLAAGAVFGNNGVHAFIGAHNGVDGAGVEAECATDATIFVDKSKGPVSVSAVLGIKWLDGTTSHLRQLADSDVAARRTLVYICVTSGDTSGVVAAAWKSALRTLGLWKACVQLFDFGCSSLAHNDWLLFNSHARACAGIRG